MKIAVLGAGAWGTALAIAFAREHEVMLWSREAPHAAAMRQDGENRAFLPGFPFLPTITPSDDFSLVTTSADLLLVVTPLSGLRETLRRCASGAVSAPILWACKGLEAGTQKLPHQIVAEEVSPQAPCGVLSGPSFAQEVASAQPTAVTLAAADLALAGDLARQLNSPRFRIYASDDLPGVEIGGAVKNVMAIAAGISDGLGFGHNARAALITRGLAEISRLALALGARRETLMGLAGLGDLVLTCNGDLSRNRRVGLALGQGQSLDQILRDLGHVAEGVYTASETATLANRMGIDMPITQAVNAVLHQGLPAAQAVEMLLARDPKIE